MNAEKVFSDSYEVKIFAETVEGLRPKFHTHTINGGKKEKQ